MAFRRALGTFDATMLVVGGIIGAGIFVNPYLVAQRLPSAGPILWIWIAGGAIALAGALAFAELASLYPKAGGEYAYLREAYHPLVAFLFGWASFLMIQGGGIAAVSIVFAEHTLRFAGSPGANPTPLAIAAIVAMALVNVLGVKPGSRVLNGLVLIKILSLAALILGGLWLAPKAPAAAADPHGGAAVRHAPRFRRGPGADTLFLRRLAERQHRGRGDALTRNAAAPRPRRGNAPRRRDLRGGQRRVSHDARPRRSRGDGDAGRRHGARASSDPARMAGSPPRSQSRRWASSTCRFWARRASPTRWPGTASSFAASAQLHPRFATPHRAILAAGGVVHRPGA